MSIALTHSLSSSHLCLRLLCCSLVVNRCCCSAAVVVLSDVERCELAPVLVEHSIVVLDEGATDLLDLRLLRGGHDCTVTRRQQPQHARDQGEMSEGAPSRDDETSEQVDLRHALSTALCSQAAASTSAHSRAAAVHMRELLPNQPAKKRRGALRRRGECGANNRLRDAERKARHSIFLHKRRLTHKRGAAVQAGRGWGVDGKKEKRDSAMCEADTEAS